ncbi:MAG: VCBS repeat-containing protein, partial [Planctomycetota bacterium]
VNRDGANDLVIPSSRALAVYLQKKNGSFEAGFEARVGVSLDTSVASKGRLDDRIGQALKIPDLEMRDVNGDGRRDLISENDDLLEVFLAKTDGRLESGAAIRVETGKLKKALEPPEGEEFNPADLTSMLARGVQTKLEDYSGDGIEDLLVRTAGKVRLYRGTKGGIDLRKPSQYLKASGHVVYAFLRDENEDNSLDLCLLRVEKISLADVFLWLVVPGSLDLEVFVYRGQGGKFARRPARRLVFTLSFPSVLSLIDMGKEMEAKRGEGSDSVARSLRTGGRADSPDTFLWSGGELRFYFDHDAGLVKGDEDVEREFEEFIGYRRDKDEYVIQVVDIIDRVVAGQASAAERLEDRSPDFTIPLPGKPKAGAVRVVDWNDDGRDGLLLIHEAKDGATSVRGTIVVTSGA